MLSWLHIFSDRKAALGFIALFWGMYAISRLITISMEGPLGDFGSQWLVIESTLSLVALGLLVIYVRLERATQAA
ncbi:MAG: DUF4345 family protein [Flavobacteriales bacterium]|nr:DUF4345 family protein [Flavobacteriales bacterium]